MTLMPKMGLRYLTQTTKNSHALRYTRFRSHFRRD